MFFNLLWVRVAAYPYLTDHLGVREDSINQGVENPCIQAEPGLGVEQSLLLPFHVLHIFKRSCFSTR